MPTRPASDNMPLRLFLVFLLLAACIIAVGYLNYRSQKKHIKNEIQNELSAIADLKVNQISTWRRERLDNATASSRNIFLASAFQEFREKPDSPGLRQGLLDWIKTRQTLFHYKRLLLVDPRGTVLLASESDEKQLGPMAKDMLEESLRTQKALLSDIHAGQVVDYVHLDLIAPIILKKRNATVPLGALVIHVDPHDFLYPLIQSWPGSSSTAETLLFRKDGDSILYLNELRHQKNSALVLRKPLTGKMLPSLIATSGKSGVFEGFDYRDVPVLAATRVVPGTPWFLVSKMDLDEIYAPLRREAAEFSVVLSMLIAAFGYILMLRRRQRNAENDRKQLALELERKTFSQRFEALSKYANDIILLIDPLGAIVEANDRAVSSYGYAREELLALTVRDLRTPTESNDFETDMDRVRRQNGYVFETVHRRKDGTTFPVEVSSRIIDAQGATYFQSIVRDISERKQAEIALINEKNRSEAIIAAIGDGITIRDRDFRVIYQNDVHRAALGNHLNEYCYQAFQQRTTPCDECPVTRSFEDGRVHTADRIVQMDGIAKYFEITSSPLRDETNTIIAGIEVVRDITNRKAIEESLRSRNRFIEAALDNLPIGIAVNQVTDGAVIYMNPKFEEIYGWPRNLIENVEEFFKKVYPDPAYRAEISARILADISSGDPSRMKWENVRIMTKSGGEKLITALNIPLLDQNLMISTVQDVTVLTRAEQALRSSEFRYKRLVESVTDYIYTVEVENGKSVATYHGPGCITVTGYSSEEYGADPDLWHRMIFPEDIDLVLDRTNKILAGAAVPPYEHRILHKDGSLHWVRNTPVPRYDKTGWLIAYDGLITDITHVRHLENQLRQAQKMEAVGQLAGGVAHDFNNILTAIIGYGNLLLMKMPSDNPGRSYVEQILSSADRAAHLTHSLLAFSRKQIIDLKPVDTNEIIRRVHKILQRVIGEDIEFNARLCPEELIILADSIQIEQVLMNLATNARDAMQDGGALRIETAPIELGEEFVRTYSYSKPGRYALITVTDTGAGMDETTRAKIFEPFFTTKDVGKGTGLGLAMVYGTIKQHDGYIHVFSEPGKGTTFKIYLPLIVAGAAELSRTETRAIPRGTETILLAEDDDTVRQLSKKVLEDFGYQVIEATDGENAVITFSRNRGRIDLLVLDIIMPRKNGKEAYDEIRKMQPDIKALFTSGYTADIIHKKGIIETGVDLILKPVAPLDFLSKVREVLDK